MGEVKELNSKNRTYQFFNDMINLNNFNLSLLKIETKTLIFTTLET